MKITFLGSSHGVPSAERYCSCAMIEVGESIYLIDAGAPVTDLLMRYGKSVDDLSAVFTTHCHSDHTNGLFGLTGLCNWYFKKAAFDVFVTNEKIPQAIASYIAATDCLELDRERLRFKQAFEGEVYDDGNVRITYIPTKHCEPEASYAILVEGEGRCVLFTGDLSSHLKKQDFPKMAMEKHTDLVVCEMAHFGLEPLKPYMEELKTDRLCFNHIYPLKKIDAIKEAAETGVYAYEITVACDGDIIEF